MAIQPVLRFVCVPDDILALQLEGLLRKDEIDTWEEILDTLEGGPRGPRGRDEWLAARELVCQEIVVRTRRKK